MSPLNAADHFWLKHIWGAQEPEPTSYQEPRSPRRYAVYNTAREQARRVRQRERLAVKQRGNA